MGRILDFFSRLEKKVDKPADPDLLLTVENESAAGESDGEAKERAAKVKRQRRAKTMRWGDR
ncbi:hypothetical protein BH10ACT11_BH10ACT11_21860 [soil metagenome]